MSTPSPVRVLVVDDHPDAAELLAMMLGDSRPRVDFRVGFDGGACVAIASLWRPHLIVTDIDMPVLSGIEAAIELRSRLVGDPPTIVDVTGKGGWNADPMAAVVFDAILVKPVEIDDLLVWVDAAARAVSSRPVGSSACRPVDP